MDDEDALLKELLDIEANPNPQQDDDIFAPQPDGALARAPGGNQVGLIGGSHPRPQQPQAPPVRPPTDGASRPGSAAALAGWPQVRPPPPVAPAQPMQGLPGYSVPAQSAPGTGPVPQLPGAATPAAAAPGPPAPPAATPAGASSSPSGLGFWELVVNETCKGLDPGRVARVREAHQSFVERVRAPDSEAARNELPARFAQVLQQIAGQRATHVLGAVKAKYVEMHKANASRAGGTSRPPSTGGPAAALGPQAPPQAPAPAAPPAPRPLSAQGATLYPQQPYPQQPAFGARPPGAAAPPAEPSATHAPLPVGALPPSLSPSHLAARQAAAQAQYRTGASLPAVGPPGARPPSSSAPPRPAIPPVITPVTPAGTKRGSGEAAEAVGPSAKRQRGAVPAATSKKERGGDGDIDEILGADAFVDLEEETARLMSDVAAPRGLRGTRGARGSSHLSEWRVGLELLRAARGAGLEGADPGCLDVIQVAFASHVGRLLRAMAAASRARRDGARRAPATQPSRAPQRGVLRIAARERETLKARAAAEKEELIRKAASRRADDRTRERAQKAKAEKQGREQATAAAAAVAATLGGKASKWNKWDKWNKGDVGKASGGGKKREGGPPAPGREAAPPSTDADADDGEVGGEQTTASLLRAAAATAAASRRASEEADGGPTEAGAAGVGAAPAAAPKHVQRAGAPVAVGTAPAPRGRAPEDKEPVGLPDVLHVLRHDPMHAHDSLIYRLANRPHPEAGPAAGAK